MIRELPPVEYLRECFRYERSTGKLYWRKRPREHFATIVAWKGWNKRRAGSEALAHIGTNKHRFGNLDGKYCSSHRVIWKLMTGKEPPPVIDHKDRDGTNNRWNNIREATKAQNCINRNISGRNTSGFGGVHKHKNKNRWVAQLGSRERKRYIGIFDSPEKARAAWYSAAAALYGDFVP